jgi:hypothetical protein
MSSDVTDLESFRAKNLGAEEKAAAYKGRVVKILGDLMDTLREAEREEYRIEFSIQRDPLGVPFFIGPTIVKRFP